MDEIAARDMVLKVQRIAAQEAARGGNVEQNLRNIQGQIIAEEKMMEKVAYRNQLLSIAAKRRVKEFTDRFTEAGLTTGEGIRAFIEGSEKKIPGARNSVDYQVKSLHGKYFGRLIAELEQQGRLRDFMRGEHERDIYHEMEQLSKDDGIPGSSGNKAALAIARAVEGITSDMIAQQNAAGAYIKKLPGYITRQVHDQSKIRAAGGPGDNDTVKQRSFEAWRDFTRPLLDPRTYQGEDPNKFLRMIHDGLYAGVHGSEAGKAEFTGGIFTGGIAKKASAHRVLHFADANSAYAYNQKFGVKSFSESIFSDIHGRARNIGLMENLGPNPEATFRSTLSDLAFDARERTDAAKQADSLRDWRIQAAFDTISGKNDAPQNVNFARAMSSIRAVNLLSKMGGALMSTLSDKVFMQATLARQGISHLDIAMKQVTGMLRGTPERQQMLRLMGVAMDGLIGNTASRYSLDGSFHGFAHRAQQKFFDLNFLNWWTDRNKAAVGELMASHLGEHADFAHADLPEELRNTLSLYDVKQPEWDALRATAWEDRGAKFVTPDKVDSIPSDVIASLVTQDGKEPSGSNILRKRQELESKLRTFYADQIDHAVPTPGAAERKYITMGTRPGTPLGEAVRLITTFRSFPMTVMTKLVSREIYGNGSMTIGHWLKNDHKGKFNMAMLIAMTTVAGYVSGAIRDAISGRTPKQLIDDDGKIIMRTLNDAALRGGGLGIMSDVLLREYDNSYKSFTTSIAGPILGQANTVFDMATKLKHGEPMGAEAGKFVQDNVPYINLFYIRPVLDYFIFWNMQEMLNPGSLARSERNVQDKNHQGFFLKPSEVVNQ